VHRTRWQPAAHSTEVSALGQFSVLQRAVCAKCPALDCAAVEFFA
jgi:hypothetical protein